MKPIILAALMVLVAARTAHADISVSEYFQLEPAEQERILVASYRTATVLLAFGGIGMGDGKLAPEKMVACLKDRDANWLRKILAEYHQKHPDVSTDFGAVFAQSMAWKCGLLTFQ